MQFSNYNYIMKLRSGRVLNYGGIPQNIKEDIDILVDYISTYENKRIPYVELYSAISGSGNLREKLHRPDYVVGCALKYKYIAKDGRLICVL